MDFMNPRNTNERQVEEVHRKGIDFEFIRSFNLYLRAKIC